MKCALCGEECRTWGEGPTDGGNNPEPIGELDDRVCDDCNGTFVIPARLHMLSEAQVNTLRKAIQWQKEIRL
jgi:hypothetical protein